MKKLLSIFLCLAMVLSMSVTAFALEMPLDPDICDVCKEEISKTLSNNYTILTYKEFFGVEEIEGLTDPDEGPVFYCDTDTGRDVPVLAYVHYNGNPICYNCLTALVNEYKSRPVAPSVASSTGTEVTFTGTQSESYTVTVPASVTVKASGDAVKGQVTVAGTWASNRKVVVTADETVTLTNSISGGDPKTLDVDFDGISKVGDNNVAIETTDDGASAIFTVANITDALFGTWTGKFNYTVGIDDVQDGYTLTIKTNSHSNVETCEASYSINGGEYQTLECNANLIINNVKTVNWKYSYGTFEIALNSEDWTSEFTEVIGPGRVYTATLTQDSILEINGAGIPE